MRTRKSASAADNRSNRTMRQEPDFFGEQELSLLYMARRLPDALKLERILTEAGIDYLVETGTYTGGLLMRRELMGAYFYVSDSVIEESRTLLVSNRYKPYRLG
ncbi:MAG: hypothetical protein JWP08_3634 [Bryobacterales bacterium]|nr:hypothetical protein [Bryobacterales bacterium]